MNFKKNKLLLQCSKKLRYQILRHKMQNPEVLSQGFDKIRQRPIFPGRLQPSIVGTGELNFCVRNGNRWDLSVIVTENISI